MGRLVLRPSGTRRQSMPEAGDHETRFRGARDATVLHLATRVAYCGSTFNVHPASWSVKWYM